ncbi:MAG: glycogen/starch synthase [Patescibacteria group bacterium]|nr:glycogen/starch synthase [Patescibacteria group bacterium]
MKKKNKIKVLMVAAECAPFAKVGGLADVAGSLPPALLKLDVDVRVIMPLYGSIDREKYKLKKIYTDFEVPSGYLMIKVNIWEAKLPGTAVKIYFIDAPDYFKYEDVYIKSSNSERFLFFSYTALYSLPILRFIPNIIHCHDSHAALIPDILAASNMRFLEGIKTLYTIHNLNYQGKTSPEVLRTGNLNLKSTKVLSRDARNGDINFMVQGILTADIINTVSKTYAKEITTSFYGADLEKIIHSRKTDLYGILNGIDTKIFDPAKDKLICKNYTAESLENKKLNKFALQKKLKLPVSPDIPLVGLISRLYWQKGLELINNNLHKLNCQFVFLGAGQQKYEKSLLKLAKKYPKQFSVNVKFSNQLAQEIYAGSDMFLMPSRYEPCGLGQMIAMRYGTVPVVRATGGLVDTVAAGAGFKFKQFSAEELYKTLEKTINIYANQPKKWQKMQINGMKKDFSWSKSAKEYLKLYKKLST